MDKQLSNLRWLMWIIGIIAFLMPVVYMLNFWDGIISDESSDWGAFGAYMGAITGLLAFLGVLYTIRQSSIQAITRDERELFFKLMEEHRRAFDSLIYPVHEQDNVKYGIEAVESYTKDLNQDFQFLIILASSLGCKTFNDWMSKLKPQSIHDFETSEYSWLYTDLAIDILEAISTFQKTTDGKKWDVQKLRDPKPIIRYAACEGAYPNVLKLILLIEQGDFDTDKFYDSKLFDSKKLALVARWIWWHSDDLGQRRAVMYAANVFYRKYLNWISHYFKNAGYTVFTINTFIERNNGFYMKYWRSRLSDNESYLLLFYLTSDRLDVDILQAVIDYKLFDNLGTRDLVDLNLQDSRGANFAYELIRTIMEEKKEEKRRNEEK